MFNIHGQNDNQQLLDRRNHVRLLDSFASNAQLTEQYESVYKEILHIRIEIDAIGRDGMERERLGEMLKYQIADIDALKLKVGEEEALEELVKKLSSAEKIISRALR